MIVKEIKLKLSKIHINQNGMKNSLCMFNSYYKSLNLIIIGVKTLFSFRLVTPYSILHYRVLDYCKFQKDVLIAEKNISLYDILCNYNGVCDNLELTIDLIRTRHHDHQASSSSTSHNLVKVGELITILHGFQIDISQVSNPSRESSSSIYNRQGTHT